MTGIKSSLHLIHARLENLERQNRRLKQGMILLMSLGGALCFMGQSPAVEKSISAEQIVSLVDDIG